jgi:hypothetical protein
MQPPTVIPAKAGILFSVALKTIPACAGMTAHGAQTMDKE